MLYETKELRWFFKDENKSIANWFANLDKDLAEPKLRSDYYLPLEGIADVGIKLREGNIEIKQRRMKSNIYQLTDNAAGYLEQWDRWSFEIKDKDELAKKITKKDKFEWIEVQKERWAIKIKGEKKNGDPKIVDIKEQLDSGCQLEYTKINVKEEKWYTFSLEWFGEQFVELSKDFLYEVLDDTRLAGKESMGYSEFLDVMAKRLRD